MTPETVASLMDALGIDRTDPAFDFDRAVREALRGLVVAREALAKYGRHRIGCQTGAQGQQVRPCACGWDAALARAAVREGEP